MGVALPDEANELVGGQGAHLIVDDTNLRKKGRVSVGVARQCCSEVGKLDNYQALVSLTMARAQLPVAVRLELYLPEGWIHDAERRRRCALPEEVGYRPKWQIALSGSGPASSILRCACRYSLW